MPSQVAARETPSASVPQFRILLRCAAPHTHSRHAVAKPGAMPEANQDQRGVPVTVAAIACDLDQLLDFGVSQVFARP
jgi:hypothetical protein